MAAEQTATQQHKQRRKHHKPPGWIPKPHPRPKTHQDFATALLAIAGTIKAAGAISLEEVGQIAADAVGALEIEWILNEPAVESLVALGVPEEAAAAGGVEFLPLVLGLVTLPIVLAESLLIGLAGFALPILIVLLGAMYFAHDVSIGVGPFKLRLGAVFDPVVSFIEGLVKHAAQIVYECIQDVVRLVKVLSYGLVLLMGGATQSEVHKVDHELGTLRKSTVRTENRITNELATMNGHIDQLGAENTHFKAEFKHVWTDLGKLQKEIDALPIPSVSGLRQSVAEIKKELRTLEHFRKSAEGHLTRIEHEFNTVNKRLTHVEHQLANEKGLTAQQAHQLHTAFHFSTVLAPLLSLGVLTAAQVGNLSAISNDLCACPRIPNLTNFELEALLADQIILNGI